MYRIHFQHDGAYWCLQFLRFGFIWRTTTDETGIPLQFDTYTDAQNYVETQGIDEVYVRQNASYHSYILRGGVK